MKQLDYALRPARRAPAPVPRPRPLMVRSGAPHEDAASLSSPTSVKSDDHGVYPCPFGFALNVTLHRSEFLVPVTGDSAASLAPIAAALALVRESGGFEAKAVRLPTAEIRLIFENVPDLARTTKRLHALAGDLLAVGLDALPAHDPQLAFNAAIELRTPSEHSLSVHLYVEGTSSAHERLLSCLAAGTLPALTRLAEAPARAETHFILRRRAIARCRIDLARLFARASSAATADTRREHPAIRQALAWLGAARSEPVLASAQNELVLANVVRMARALGHDAGRILAEGHCHAVRFGSLAPLARFELDAGGLVGMLELPLGFDSSRHCRDAEAELAQRLVRESSPEERALLSTCLGLAAHLATLQAATSLALSGATPARLSAPPVASDAEGKAMAGAPLPLPLPIDWEARRSSLPPPPIEPRVARVSGTPLPPARRSSLPAPPVDFDATLVTPLRRLAADIEKSLAPAPGEASPFHDLENTVVTPARRRSLPAPAPAQAAPARPASLSAARAKAAANSARATLLPPPNPTQAPAARATLLPPPPVAKSRPAPARGGASQSSPGAKSLAPAQRAALPPPSAAPPRPSSRASSTLPPLETSAPPPLESLVAPRPVPRPAPTRSMRAAAPPPDGAAASPAPSRSSAPPRRQREESGIHPAARAASTLPPPRRNPRQRDWG